MAAGPPPRGAAEAEPLLDTSARLVDIKNARRIAQFLTSVIALATFVVLAIHNGTGRGSWGGVVDSRPSTSASPVHGMPYVPITGRSRLARRVDDTPDATRRALRRERLEIDELVARGRGCSFGKGAASSGRIGRAHRRGGRRGRDTADGDTDERIPRAPRIQRPNDAPGDGLGHADVPPPRSRRPGG